ncbi:GntR family transcriptional regulator [Micromonospora palythoicola]|uniref:GntR family transcriptional regulator n=1 Tax=Micromonospora palythoicola TaxID=3120507 RepID=UPI0038CC17CD
MRARHRTSRYRRAGGRPGGISRPPARQRARRTVRHRTGRVSPSHLYARLPQPAHQDAAPPARPGRRSTTPDTHRQPSRTLGNVPTSGRVVYTSKRRSRLALGKTSARYGDQVPTPHYGLPRYRAIADELRRRIETGAIPPGTLLPTESALTAEFKASRGTVRQAIGILRQEGSVITEHGRGTYANANCREQNAGHGSPAQVARREVAADARLAALFGIDIGTKLIETETVKRRGEVVEAVTRVYAPHTSL